MTNEVAGFDEAAAVVARARTALSDERWIDALELATQALTADPSLDEAAAVVGIARHHLGALGRGDVQLRQLTIVAVDMCGSTAIAAAIGPERYRELMMELYSVCAEAIGRYAGRVVKYSGDGVLAQFGYPIAHDNDGRRAALGAHAVLDGVRRRRSRWQTRYGATVEVRAGLDTGVVAVGPIDAGPWATDEIAGDPPNVAARVQALADPMGVWVTEATHQLIEGWFDTEALGEVTLRNYPRPVRLYRVLRATDADNRLEARTSPLPMLVDRTAELELMRREWSEVVSTGRRRVVGFSGPAGIGKSRVMGHLVATAVASGATPISLACSPLHRSSPLRPVTRALRQRFRVGPGHDGEPELSEICRRLEQLPARRLPTELTTPVLAWLLGRPGVVDLPPDTLRRRAFDVLIDLVEALAARGPVVLHVDDADVADPSTAELLAELLDRPPDAALLVILAGRTLPRAMSRDVSVELAALSAAEAATLARSIGPALSEETIQRIVDRCGGLPFYVEELARSAAETHAEVATEAVELSAFVAARLDELGAPLRRLVELVALAGRELDVDVLARLAELSPDRLTPQIAELTERGVLRRSQGTRGEVVGFRHDVVREVAYQTLLAARRTERHLRLAHILAELPAGAVRPDDLARHHALGGDHATALRWWLEAGRAAVATGARREAIELFSHALTATELLPRDARTTGAELEAQLGLGTALSTIHGYTAPRARAAFEQAMRLAESLDDSSSLFPAVWGIWTYWFVLGEHATAMTLGDRCVSISARAEDDRLRWGAAAIVGYERLYLGDFSRARTELELASRHAGIEPVADFPQDPGMVSQAALAVVLFLLGEPERSAEAAQRAFDLVERMDPTNRRAPFTRAWVANKLAWRAQLAGDSLTAIELADRAIAVSAEHGFTTWLSVARMHRCIADCQLGRTDEALPELAALVETWKAAGRDPDGRQRHAVLMTPYFAGRLAEALHATGEHRRAARIVEAQLAATAANGEHFWDAPLRELRRSLNRIEEPA